MQFSKSFYLPKNRLEKGLLHNVTNIDCLHKVNNEKFEQLYLSAIQKLRILSIKTFM